MATQASTATATGVTCAKCAEPTVGKSKYCREHRREARAAFKAMLEAKSGEREERYAEYASTYEAAIEAGKTGTSKLKPATITGSPEAYLTVLPRTSGFAKWLVREKHVASDGTLVLDPPRLAHVRLVGKALKAAGFEVRVEVPVEV